MTRSLTSFTMAGCHGVARSEWQSCLAAVVWTVFASPAAAAVPNVPRQAFALWPPNYCGKGDGGGTQYGSASYMTIYSRTWSLRAPSGPTCETPSEAPSNTFAAYAKLMGYSGGGLFVCQYGDHEPNPADEYFVADFADVPRCSVYSCAIRAEWRITYGGQPQYGNDTGAAFTC